MILGAAHLQNLKNLRDKMPTPGISLFGFLDQAPALQYLQYTCVPANPNDAGALLADWTTAKSRLGAPTPNAGFPNIQPIPSAHSGHVAQLYAQQWAQQSLNMAAVKFELVEIEPLLAYQLHISTNHTGKHSATFSTPPSMDELMNCCLQINRPPENWVTTYGQQSMLITSKDLNVKSLANGPLAQNLAGLVYGIGLPWVHVVRFNGRCYLHNGFHRAYGARIAGATHIPCVVRDVATAAEAGIRTDGGTFTQQLLESPNPPTLCHFATGRAFDVPLRQFTKALHITWAEYVVADE